MRTCQRYEQREDEAVYTRGIGDLAFYSDSFAGRPEHTLLNDSFENAERGYRWPLLDTKARTSKSSSKYRACGNAMSC